MHDLRELIAERFWFLATLILTLIVKLALTVAELAEEEVSDEPQTKRRIRRASTIVNGLLSGLLCGLILPGPLIDAVPWIDRGSEHVVIVIFTLAGSEIVRQLHRPRRVIDRLLTRFIGRGSEDQ